MMIPKSVALRPDLRISYGETVMMYLIRCGRGRGFGFVFLSIATLLLAACDLSVEPGPSPAPPVAQAPAPSKLSRPAGLAETRVTRVVDGDTIEISGGIKVRYIGIDTPETKHPRKPVQHYGPEASAANKRLVEGQVVGLEFDVDRTDKYGRTLAYIWVGDTMVNAWLVENGFARVSTYVPNVKYTPLFTRLQAEARSAGRGMWGGAPAFSTPPSNSQDSIRSPTPQAQTVYATRTGERYHRGSCSSLRSSRIPMRMDQAAARGLSPCKRCW